MDPKIEHSHPPISPSPPTTLARRVSPDDIRAGQFVGVLAENHQIVSRPCNDEAIPRPPVSYTVSCWGCSDGSPRRVVAVCLPFVMVEKPTGSTETFDIRRHVLVEVSEQFGQEAFTRPKAKDDEDW